MSTMSDMEDDVNQPNLIGKTETHDLYSLDGAFFAVPHTLGELKLERYTFHTQAGIVTSRTKEGLLDLISSSRLWADSRGRHESQEKQLSIEQWGETKFDVVLGQEVEEYQFSNILPGKK